MWWVFGLGFFLIKSMERWFVVWSLTVELKLGENISNLWWGLADLVNKGKQKGVEGASVLACPLSVSVITVRPQHPACSSLPLKHKGNRRMFL